MIQAEQDPRMLRAVIAMDCYRERLKIAVSSGMTGSVGTMEFHEWLARLSVADADALIKALDIKPR